jgi:hypothetical protein
MGFGETIGHKVGNKRAISVQQAGNKRVKARTKRAISAQSASQAVQARCASLGQNGKASVK